MRPRAVIMGLTLACAVATGCGRQCLTDAGDCGRVQTLELPADLERNAADSLTPSSDATCAPTTVGDTARTIRYLSLREGIAIGLENGHRGMESPAMVGMADDRLVAFDGNTLTGADSIRVLALDPSIVATNIERSLSKFDTIWTTSLNWNRADNPVGSSLESVQAASAEVQAIHTDTVKFNTGLIKPLPTGGVAGITFITDYQKSNLNEPVNPAYRPALQFQFEQPLLRGFGVEINQLRSSHPGSLLTPFFTSAGVEGILITRIRFDEARAEFERNLNYLLINVETAYWNLYGSYYQLYSREEGMRQALKLWRLNKERFEAGQIDLRDLSEARLQYETFRGQRLAALGQVLENERQLRGLIGLPIEDGFRLVPAEAPILIPYHPDWSAALNEALARRPELVLARQDLKFRQLDIIRQRNQLLPDLRFTLTDNVHSLGSTIDGGPQPDSAFHELVSDPFNTLSLGLQMNVPLGFRNAHASLRAAQLNLARSYQAVRTEEDKARNYLGRHYRQVDEFYKQILVQQSALEAAHEQLRVRYDQFLQGTESLDVLLRAQTAWADTFAAYYAAIVQYNNALAGFEFAMGTIMQYDGVFIGEGPLPHGVQMRAVEHERQRTQAMVLRERTQAVSYPILSSDKDKADPGLPQLPTNRAASLPALFDRRPPLPVDLPGGKPESHAIGAGVPNGAACAPRSSKPELAVDFPSKEAQPVEPPPPMAPVSSK